MKTEIDTLDIYLLDQNVFLSTANSHADCNISS